MVLRAFHLILSFDLDCARDSPNWGELLNDEDNRSGHPESLFKFCDNKESSILYPTNLSWKNYLNNVYYQLIKKYYGLGLTPFFWYCIEGNSIRKKMKKRRRRKSKGKMKWI